MIPLNNATTQDGYTSSTTLDCPGAVALHFIVTNAAIFFQVRQQDPAGGAAAWSEERFLPPGGGPPPDTRCDAVRVRSAAAGKPAQVTIHPDPGDV